jgi:O-antigen ligase
MSITAQGLPVRKPLAMAGLLDTRTEYFLLLVIVLMTGGMAEIWSLVGGGDVAEGSGLKDRGAGNTLFQIVVLLAYGYFWFIMLRASSSRLLQILLRNWPLIILVLLCFFSFFWSVQPVVSVRRAFALVMTTGLAAYIGLRMPQQKMIWIFGLACLGICIAGVMAVPFHGIGLDTTESHLGDLQGLTGQKNSMGRYCALGVFIFTYLVYFRLGPRRFCIGAAVFCGFCLLASASMTALGCTIVATVALPVLDMVIMPTYRRVRLTPGVKGMIIFSALLLAAIILLWGIPTILGLMGRTDTLSGRARVWDYAIPIGEKRPLLGAGYRTFWIDELTGDFLVLTPHYRTKGAPNENLIMNNGHSGYLDLWLELGWIGVILFAIFTVSFVVRVSGFLRTNIPDRRPLVFGGALLLFYLIYSYTEKVTLQQSELFWLMLMSTYFSLSQNTGNGAGPAAIARLQAGAGPRAPDRLGP